MASLKLRSADNFSPWRKWRSGLPLDASQEVKENRDVVVYDVYGGLYLENLENDPIFWIRNSVCAEATHLSCTTRRTDLQVAGHWLQRSSARSMVRLPSAASLKTHPVAVRLSEWGKQCCQSSGEASVANRSITLKTLRLVYSQHFSYANDRFGHTEVAVSRTRPLFLLALQQAHHLSHLQTFAAKKQFFRRGERRER